MRLNSISRATVFRPNLRRFFDVRPSRTPNLSMQPTLSPGSIPESNEIRVPDWEDVLSIYVETVKIQTDLFDFIEEARGVTIADAGRFLI